MCDSPIDPAHSQADIIHQSQAFLLRPALCALRQSLRILPNPIIQIALTCGPQLASEINTFASPGLVSTLCHCWVL